jgi:hypothetical protein
VPRRHLVNSSCLFVLGVMPPIHSCDRIRLVGIQIVLFAWCLLLRLSPDGSPSCCRSIVNRHSYSSIGPGFSWPTVDPSCYLFSGCLPDTASAAIVAAFGCFSHHSCNRCFLVFLRGYLFLRFIPVYFFPSLGCCLH